MDKIYTLGQKQNKPIIFIHGFPFDHTMWDKITTMLSNTFYCISYNVRGLGKYYYGDGQFTVETLADDVFDIIKNNGIEKPVICGLSMGGYIALRCIARNEELFSGLILCDTKAEIDSNEGKLKRAQAIDIINEKGLNSYLKIFMPTCFSKNYLDNFTSEYNHIFIRSNNFNPKGVKGCQSAMAGRIDSTSVLEKISVPSLILVGEEDTFSPPDQMIKIHEKIKNSSFKVINNSGHIISIENPVETASAIKEFLLK